MGCEQLVLDCKDKDERHSQPTHTHWTERCPTPPCAQPLRSFSPSKDLRSFPLQISGLVSGYFGLLLFLDSRQGSSTNSVVCLTISWSTNTPAYQREGIRVCFNLISSDSLTVYMVREPPAQVSVCLLWLYPPDFVIYIVPVTLSYLLQHYWFWSNIRSFFVLSTEEIIFWWVYLLYFLTTYCTSTFTMPNDMHVRGIIP